MNAISELNRMPETKAQQETFINTAIGEILSGEKSPLKIELQLKIAEDTIKKIRSDVRVKNLMLEEVEKYGKDGYINGEITIRMKGRRTVDYSNDTIHLQLKAKLKAREAELKTTGAIPETGEQLIIKYSEFIEIKY